MQKTVVIDTTIINQEENKMREKIKEKLSGVCNRISLKKYEIISTVKERKDKGISALVVQIFLVVIVVALCIIFRDKIAGFIDKVMGKVDGAADAAF